MEPSIPKGVIREGDILGLISTLKYAHHDITDEKKFPKLVPSKFLKKSISSETHMIVIEPHAWASGLQKAGLLNMFDIPHFGQSQGINVCVKMLLSCVHGGYMWLNKSVSINIDLIVRITGLLSQVQNPASLFFDKKNEKVLAESMKEKLHTFNGQRGMDVASICDPRVRFATQALACKLLIKCKKDQVPFAVIAVAKQCVKDVQMN